jgi:hypothetical protein
MLEGEGYSYSGWFRNAMLITSMTTIGGYREGKLAINFDDGGLYSISKGHHMDIGGFISG